MEHLRSIQPSLLINLYILITLPMDAARARTLWLRGGSLNLAAAFTSTVSIKLLILVTEAFEKRDILLAEYKDVSPETTSGIYSRSFFWWLNPLLRDGFRKVLTDEDLYPVDEDMKSEAVERRFKREWTKEKDKTKKNALVWRLLWSIRGPLARGIFPRLCVTVFNYTQPFLITAVVNFLTQPANDDSAALGWALTVAYGLDYLGLAIANGAYMHQTFRTITITRGAIVTAIYSQTVDLKLTSVDESAALTLMATDVERICLAFQYMHSLWSAPLEICLGVYLLWRQISLASMGPVCLTLTSSLLVLWLSRFTAQAQMQWVKVVQSRIDATSKIIGGMKAVKMLGLSNVMHHIIQTLRDTEVHTSLWFRKLTILGIALGKGSEVLAPGVAFAAFTVISQFTGRPLEVGAAYSSLNIVNLLMVPLNGIIQSLPTITAAFGCFDRIQAFLNLPAQRDHRLMSSAEAMLQPRVFRGMQPNEIELRDMSTQRDLELRLSVRVHDASFSWKEDEPVIQNVTFDVRDHSFTTLIGPVGSGKSTLLKGLVGETPSNQGFVYTKEMQVGFVDQTSWIQNGSLQSNILGVSVFERDWYATVVHACALQDDIDTLPQGDQTSVGSAGISLSGGQKQRLVCYSLP
jgi:ATP-binding cassette, subfamily C (CFTR/MRP), member 1